MRIATVLGGCLSLVATMAFGAPVNDVADGRHTYLVFFGERPLARHWDHHRQPGEGAPRGRIRLDPTTPTNRAYLDYLKRLQNERLEGIRQALGRSPEILHRYLAAGNAVALSLHPTEADHIRHLPGVIRVVEDRELFAATDRSPEFIGAPDVWDGSAVPNGLGSRGEGTVIAVLDSGINMDHPSFAATAGDGYTHSNPLGTSNFLGWCDPDHPDFDPAYVCNDKLIGAWDFEDIGMGDGPEDDDGHGSHTAGTAAGNEFGPGTLSGVAPRANLVVYDICRPLPGDILSCSTTAAGAAIDQAILDGVVDVINFSVTGGQDPWGGDVDTFFLDAVAAGIFVAAAGGNAGSLGTVDHRGPWITSVAASSHDRVGFENQLTDLSGGISPPSEPISGASRTTGYGPAPVVYAGNFGNGDDDPRFCTAPFPPGTWTQGEIVMCDLVDNDRTVACAHAAAGGAGGCLLANSQFSLPQPEPEAHVIPTVHVSWSDRNDLVVWLAMGSGHTATITDGAPIFDPNVGDRVASFSSRGPNEDFDTLKPDLTAPGVDVFAPVRTTDGLTAPEFASLGGTSMASPHVAGAAALLRAIHPDWTVPEIQSAMMTTAETDVTANAGQPASPQEMGAGRLDVARAAAAGLVLDESVANFEAADPSQGGDPASLNRAGLQSGDCDGECLWQRTVRGTRERPVSWTASSDGPSWMEIRVEPSQFSIADSVTTQTLTIRLIVRPGAPVGQFWRYGGVTLTPDDPTIPAARFTIAVFPTGLMEGEIFADGFESGDTSAW